MGRIMGSKNRYLNTHCKNGHEFTPENTFLGIKGQRNCRTCRNTRVRAKYRADHPLVVEPHVVAAPSAEIAWAAGLFEGEGCIYAGVRGAPRLALSMKDRDVVEHFMAVVGAGTLYPDQHGMTRWQAGRLAQVHGILVALLPYLGERRSAKAEAALAHRLTRQAPRAA